MTSSNEATIGRLNPTVSQDQNTVKKRHTYQVNAGAVASLCLVVPNLCSIGSKIPNLDSTFLINTGEILAILR